MPKPPRTLSFPLSLADEVDRLFNEIIHRPWGIERGFEGWSPSVDLYETSEALILEADLPGVKIEDIKVEVEGDELMLQGRRSHRRNHSDGRFHFQERAFGEFERRMTLPESVDKERIKAEFSNGVLRVTLPKLKKKIKTL